MASEATSMAVMGEHSKVEHDKLIPRCLFGALNERISLSNRSQSVAKVMLN